ncbi:fucolectin-5-like [Rhopilema esculentum]|uniref:fucolectin-5-like n=1 Tax=Rhopilema esculentum TaxID=499914 RepID=UPI0031D35965
MEEEKEKISLPLARTYQSSEPTNSYKAIDGIKCNDYQACTCTHTESGPPHWWAVEFPQASMVKAVSIVNRGDCCSERLRDFNIRVGFLLENGANPFCRRNVGILTAKEVMFECDELVLGKYLFIESNVSDDLTICELEVYGELFF